MSDYPATTLREVINLGDITSATLEPVAGKARIYRANLIGDGGTLTIPSAGEISEWVQPESTNPYMTGDQVTHNGSTWTNDLDGNVWEPGVYGWTENL